MEKGFDPCNPLNLGIIGCGEQARRHLQAYGDLFRCMACCDRSREAAESLRSEWHIGAAYTEVHRLLRRQDIDLVALMTPARTYAELITAVAQAGKHIYLGGPWAASREALQTALEACRSAAVHVGMAQPHRALPWMGAARRVLDSGLLGTPFLAHWETAHLCPKPTDLAKEVLPNLWLEGLAPEIDLLCYLVRRPVTEVYARAGRGPFRAASGPGGETWAALTLTLADGVVAQMFYSGDCQSELRPVKHRFHLECAQGALFVNEEGADTVAAYLANQRAWLRPDWPPDPPHLRQEMEEFLERLTEGGEPELPAPDRFYALEAAWAAQESWERNLPVAVQPLFPAAPSVRPEAESRAHLGPALRTRRRPRRARLSPEDARLYATRPVPQTAPPVLVLSDLPEFSPEKTGLTPEEPLAVEAGAAEEAFSPLPLEQAEAPLQQPPAAVDVEAEAVEYHQSEDP